MEGSNQKRNTLEERLNSYHDKLTYCATSNKLCENL